MFTKINELKSKLDSSKPLSSLEIKRLTDDFKIEFTYDSNAIEGSTVTLDETYAIVNGKVTIGGKSTKEYLDTVNHADAFDFLLNIVKDKYDFDERLIKEIHSIVLANEREHKGTYRKIPARVGSYLPTDSLNIQTEIDNLLSDYTKNSAHIIEKISIFHLMFECIHPFVDGNGRTGRLLMNFELMRNGFPPINIKFQDKDRYYNCFIEYQKTGSPNSMIQLVTELLEIELNRYLSFVTA